MSNEGRGLGITVAFGRRGRITTQKDGRELGNAVVRGEVKLRLLGSGTVELWSETRSFHDHKQYLSTFYEGY